MARRFLHGEDKRNKVNRRRTKSAETELIPSLSGLQEPANLPYFPTNNASIKAQAARLSDPELQSAQRQVQAVQIGQVQGNQHLQRLIRPIKQPGQNGTSAGGNDRQLIPRNSIRKSPTMVAREFVETELRDGETRYRVGLDVERTAFHLRVANLSQPQSPPGTDFALVRRITGIEGNVLNYDASESDSVHSFYELDRNLGNGEIAMSNRTRLEALGLVPPDWFSLSRDERQSLERELGDWILWSVHRFCNACNTVRDQLEEQRENAEEVAGLLIDICFAWVMPGFTNRLRVAFQGIEEAGQGIRAWAVEHVEDITEFMGDRAKEQIKPAVERTIQQQTGDELITQIRQTFDQHVESIAGEIPTMPDQRIVVLAGQYHPGEGNREEAYVRVIRGFLMMMSSDSYRTRIQATLSMARLATTGRANREIVLAQMIRRLRDPDLTVCMTAAEGIRIITGTAIEDQRFIQLCQLSSNDNYRVRIQVAQSIRRLASHGDVDRAIAVSVLRTMMDDPNSLVRQTAGNFVEQLGE